MCDMREKCYVSRLSLRICLVCGKVATWSSVRLGSEWTVDSGQWTGHWVPDSCVDGWAGVTGKSAGKDCMYYVYCF